MWGLYLSALLIGAAGIPHCLAMCSAPCAGAARACAAPGCAAASQAPTFSLHAGRLAGYAMLGALAALLGSFSRDLAGYLDALQPIWNLAQLGLLVAGLALLVTGRAPAWLQNVSVPARRLPMPSFLAPYPRREAQARAVSIGLVWAALPCAQLYSGVIVSALAPTPWQGAGVMLAFGLPGTAALLLGSRLWVVASSRARRVPAPDQPLKFARPGTTNLLDERWPVRLAGASLACAAAWLLWHSMQAGPGGWCL